MPLDGTLLPGNHVCKSRKISSLHMGFLSKCIWIACPAHCCLAENPNFFSYRNIIHTVHSVEGLGFRNVFRKSFDGLKPFFTIFQCFAVVRVVELWHGQGLCMGLGGLKRKWIKTCGRMTFRTRQAINLRKSEGIVKLFWFERHEINNSKC